MSNKNCYYVPYFIIYDGITCYYDDRSWCFDFSDDFPVITDVNDDKILESSANWAISIDHKTKKSRDITFHPSSWSYFNIRIKYDDKKISFDFVYSEYVNGDGWEVVNYGKGEVPRKK